MGISTLRSTLLASALIAVTATPAFAAEDPKTPAPAPQDAAAAPAASSDQATNSSGLGDIIVTATKVSTNLQKTPISISVVDAKALEDRHVLSLFNLADGSVP